LIALHGVKAIRISRTKFRKLFRKSAVASSAIRTDTRMNRPTHAVRTACDTRSVRVNAVAVVRIVIRPP